jgi:hypothetical protein
MSFGPRSCPWTGWAAKWRSRGQSEPPARTSTTFGRRPGPCRVRLRGPAQAYPGHECSGRFLLEHLPGGICTQCKRGLFTTHTRSSHRLVGFVDRRCRSVKPRGVRMSYGYDCMNVLYPVSTNCMPMAVTISPMNRVTMACVFWLTCEPS